MKRAALLLAGALVGLSLQAQNKKIYIPEDLRKMDLQADTSQWSLKRSIETDDLILMWERGFGHDTSNPPMLEGKPMGFNLANLRDRVQSFYTFFRDTLQFSLPGSKCDQYKMMVMVMYSLDGTAYGGTYDNFIGALWVAPNRIQDQKLHGPRTRSFLPAPDTCRLGGRCLGRQRFLRDDLAVDALAGEPRLADG